MGPATASDIGIVMVKIVDRAVSFFVNEAGLEGSYRSVPARPRSQAIQACVPISGSLRGLITISASKSTALEIMQRLLGDCVPAQEESGLLEDTLAEVLNIIVGNATRDLDECGLRLFVCRPLRYGAFAIQGPAGSGHHIGYHREILTAAGPVGFGFSADAADVGDSMRIKSYME